MIATSYNIYYTGSRL